VICLSNGAFDLVSLQTLVLLLIFVCMWFTVFITCDFRFESLDNEGQNQRDCNISSVYKSTPRMDISYSIPSLHGVSLLSKLLIHLSVSLTQYKMLCNAQAQ